MTPFWLQFKGASFEAFVSDQLVRSLDCAPWVNRLSTEDEIKGLGNTVLSQGARGWLRGLHRKIEEFLLQTVQVNLPGGHEPVSDVLYHRRFGWIGVLREHEIFLGKMDLGPVGKLAVGPRTYFSGHQTLKGEHPVVFGAFCSVAEGLYLNSTPDFHAMKNPSTYEFHDEPRDPASTWNMGYRNAETAAAPTGISVGHAVWIGRNVRLFHGVEVGNGCVIAENSLVRGKLEPYGVYAGVPAKLKRLRFSDKVISALEDIQWWNWGPERIKRNKAFFETDLTTFDGAVKNLIVE
jgi:acetyltransferase-like isoleucine patch superfamily enzyme